MAAPERFAESQIPLAPRAPSIHGCTRTLRRKSDSSCTAGAVRTWPTADQRVHRGMSATDQSRHQHPIPAPHTPPHRPRHAACRTGMWWVVRNSSIQSLDYRNGTSPLAPPTYIAGFSSYLDVQAGASPHWVHCVLLGSLLTTVAVQPGRCRRFIGTLLARIKYAARTSGMEDKDRRSESLVVADWLTAKN